MPPDSIKIPDLSAAEDVMVIHRNIGLGKDLDWLKDLQAQKILLISKDAQQQRRLKLQLLQDARFIVLTEEEAAAAQIRQLQEEVQRLQERLAPLEEKAGGMEGKAQEQESLLTELRSQLQQQEQEAKQQVERLQQENQTWAEKQQGQERENARLERQLELLRDLLRARLQPTEANATAD